MEGKKIDIEILERDYENMNTHASGYRCIGYMCVTYNEVIQNIWHTIVLQGLSAKDRKKIIAARDLGHRLEHQGRCVTI